MFICKICDEEYDENMRYSRDSRYCKKCGEECTQYLSYRRWIVNTFSDKFFQVIFPILYRRLIP